METRPSRAGVGEIWGRGIQAEEIEQTVLLVRGQRVVLDRDLAALYGVTTGNLNKAVRRIQLTAEEAEASRFQFGA